MLHTNYNRIPSRKMVGELMGYNGNDFIAPKSLPYYVLFLFVYYYFYQIYIVNFALKNYCLILFNLRVVFRLFGSGGIQPDPTTHLFGDYGELQLSIHI